MDVIQSIILGIVEGVTEFLPISSTFHLIFSSKFLGIVQTDFVKLFEVVIQAGAVLSVVILYGRELVKNRELSQKILVSFIPTAVVGLVLYRVIKNIFFETPNIMLAAFALVGAVFILVEYLVKENKLSKKDTELSYKDAIIVGLVQSLAVVPGVSRAGAVIVGMMLLGYRRDEAAKYSFMLAVPTILAASILDLFKMRAQLVGYSDNILLLVVGFITAFITSYLVIKWLIQYLQSHTLTAFGIYRLVLAIILLALFR